MNTLTLNKRDFRAAVLGPLPAGERRSDHTLYMWLGIPPRQRRRCLQSTFDSQCVPNKRWPEWLQLPRHHTAVANWYRKRLGY